MRARTDLSAEDVARVLLDELPVPEGVPVEVGHLDLVDEGGVRSEDDVARAALARVADVLVLEALCERVHEMLAVGVEGG
jgi:hypothetical protein